MTAALLVALVSSPASAWNHTGWVWKRDAFPVVWYMSDYVTPQLDEEFQLEVMVESINAWNRDAPCAQLTTEFGGVRKGHWETGASPNDEMNTVYYDDPALQNSDSALGVTYTVTTGEFAFTLGDPNEAGVTNYYFYTRDSDIIFSQGIYWLDNDSIESGDCPSGGFAIQSTATHEFGHLWGLDHPCEDEDVRAGDCTDPAWYDATMFWTGSECDTSRNSLGTDDIDSILALYGPYASFVVSEESDRFGGVPLDVCFVLETKGTEDSELEVTWNFGDGSTSTELSPCHTYTSKGQFTVSVAVEGKSDECGDFEYTYREAALVLACEVPQPSADSAGLFTYEWVEGNIYQMVNEADLSVYGCIDQVQWDVFKGDELVQSVSAWSPKIDFGEPGDYEVVLNLGGPGGIAAESLVVTVGDESKGCSAVSASAGLIGLGLALGAAARRRRRD